MASPDSIARKAGKAGRARKARSEVRRSGFEVPRSPNLEPSLVPPVSCGAYPDWPM